MKNKVIQDIGDGIGGHIGIGTMYGRKQKI